MAIRTLRSTLMAIACLGMLCFPVLGSEPKDPRFAPRPLALDVKLDETGFLSGELRDRQGRVKPHTELRIWRGNTLLKSTRTNPRGEFRVPEMRGGVYRICSPGTSVTCRVWQGELAPPAARARLLLVDREISARGQQPITEVFVANPFLMGTVIAAAIAIPIAVHNSGDDEDLPDGS